ncbi:PepSY domain-containing protein [Shewanella sp. UCD-KL12]|uniref:PepSY domain-containing protein n=1 Tax=Shewanella sp. UCD-KL12 TaxID=1917163 RepID=UPI0015C3A37B|nr:PepSY domain-containing protein [Shewanella sp. UCD-KL12]
MSKIASKLHKILSLIFMPLLIIFAVSGIGLNHPSLIQSVSLPITSLPTNYHFANWNRGAIQVLVEDENGGVYAGGKSGLGYFYQGHYQQITNPLARHAWQNLIYSLYLNDNELYIGSRDGLFRYSLDTQQWRYFDQTQDQRIVSIIKGSEQQIIAVANHQLFTIEEDKARIFNISLAESKQAVPLFRFIFALHSGEILGLPGRLLMDVTALALIYFCLSGLYYWLFPKATKRNLLSRERKIKGGKLFRFMAKHHNSLGLIFMPLLIICATTAMVMRPPGLLFIVSANSPIDFNAEQATSKLPYKITQAAMLDEKLVLLTRDGAYSGAVKEGSLLMPMKASVPIHGMGATILQPLNKNELLVGSFSGLFKWRINTDEFQAVQPSEQSEGLMPVAAYSHLDELIVFDYHQGKILDAEKRLSEMPVELNEYARMSLWHFLFELHNLRIFQHYIGPTYLIVLLLSGLGLLIITITGTIQYLRKRARDRVRDRRLL